MEELLQTWGYFAAFIGTFLEGEVLLLSTVVAAQLGYMHLFFALFTAFMGAYTRDCFTFFLARKKGKTFIEAKPKVKEKLTKVNGWMLKNPNLLLLTYRFFYGFVTVVVILTGMSDISIRRFAFLSAVSNILWVVFYGLLGFFFAETMLKNLDILNQNKSLIAGILLLLGCVYWLFVKRK